MLTRRDNGRSRETAKYVMFDLDLAHHAPRLHRASLTPLYTGAVDVCG